MTERYVVFSHGKDSEPWGSKIAAMAEIAREEGFHVESVDYRGIEDPQARVTRLLAFCKDLRGSLVLVGSSMGGYVSVAGSSLLQARGMSHAETAIAFKAAFAIVGRQSAERDRESRIGIFHRP